MSGPKCVTYLYTEPLTPAERRAAVHDAEVREATRQRREADRKAALAAAAARDAAVCEVRTRNARIAALAASCEEFREQHGDAVAVRPPEPLEVGTHSTSALEAWCAEADRAVAAAERELREQAARAVATGLFADLAGSSGGPRRTVGAAELFADRAEPAGTADQQDQQDQESVERTLTRVLSRLLPDCGAEHRADARRAAARVAAAATPDEARSWLTETRLRVQRANEAAEVRRQEAGEAIGLLHDLEHAGAADAEPVRALLAEVAAGRRTLDAALRRRAADCRAAAAAEAEQQYVVNTVTDALGDLGYQVSEGFETLTVTDGVLRLSRREWSEHAVNLVVDQQGAQLRTALVRTAAGAGDDDAHLDVEREEQWCADFRELRGRLARAGLSTDLQVAVPPGQVPVPVVASQPAPGRRAGTGYRERER